MESALSFSTARMLSRSSFQLHGRSRFGLLNIYPQFRRNIISFYLPNFSSKSQGGRSLQVSASITAKPSSELRKKPNNSRPEDKLAALRELFIRPDINVDAYVIPSQDAQIQFNKRSLSPNDRWMVSSARGLPAGAGNVDFQFHRTP